MTTAGDTLHNGTDAGLLGSSAVRELGVSP